MGLRYGIAKLVARSLHWGLTHIARRPGANLPGKVALVIDPQAIQHARGALQCGAVMVTGTNGKTTVNNLLADAVEQSDATVCCNRTGANLAYGVASALLDCRGADWGIIESDELWLSKSLPALQPRYLVLLNLFRDQLDRVGEIDHIQDVIVEALGKSMGTGLIYNADDPLCAMVAERAAALPGREEAPSIAFGAAEPMNLEQNAVSDTTMCQRCTSMLDYDWRQYGQLGSYHCPVCGFARPHLDVEARDIRFTAEGLSFTVRTDDGHAFPIRTHLAGSYMVYNMLAVAAAATRIGCSPADVQAAIDAFDPQNGRLQEFRVGSHRTLLNLAKNPTGFNQNLRIVVQRALASENPDCAIAFFINDHDVDGHDISWIWDIDFEELQRLPQARVFAGGTRKHDLQVRLKYAGIPAQLIDGMEDVFSAELPEDADAYAIANYTALAPVHAELDKLQKAAPAQTREATAVANDAQSGAAVADYQGRAPVTASPSSTRDATATDTTTETDAARPSDTQPPVVIAHMFPDLLNLYGDGGNVRILETRLRERGIPVEVRHIEHGQTVDLDEVDLLFLGGGPDREQTLAAEQLMAMREPIAEYVEAGGPVLAICGGYQILGRTWLSSDGEVPGLGVLDIETRRAGSSTDRLIDNIALDSPTAQHPVIGYENHASRTYLGPGVRPFGAVMSTTGHGNNDDDRADGALYKNVLGTYLHGTLLAKNPEVADWMLERALAHNALRTGSLYELLPLDDAVELAANAAMAHRLLPKHAHAVQEKVPAAHHGHGRKHGHEHAHAPHAAQTERPERPEHQEKHRP